MRKHRFYAYYFDAIIKINTRPFFPLSQYGLHSDIEIWKLGIIIRCKNQDIIPISFLIQRKIVLLISKTLMIIICYVKNSNRHQSKNSIRYSIYVIKILSLFFNKICCHILRLSSLVPLICQSANSSTLYHSSTQTLFLLLAPNI